MCGPFSVKKIENLSQRKPQRQKHEIPHSTSIILLNWYEFEARDGPDKAVSGICGRRRSQTLIKRPPEKQPNHRSNDFHSSTRLEFCSRDFDFPKMPFPCFPFQAVNKYSLWREMRKIWIFSSLLVCARQHRWNGWNKKKPATSIMSFKVRVYVDKSIMAHNKIDFEFIWLRSVWAGKSEELTQLWNSFHESRQLSCNNSQQCLLTEDESAERFVFSCTLGKEDGRWIASNRYNTQKQFEIIYYFNRINFLMGCRLFINHIRACFDPKSYNSLSLWCAPLSLTLAKKRQKNWLASIYYRYTYTHVVIACAEP